MGLGALAHSATWPQAQHFGISLRPIGGIFGVFWCFGAFRPPNSAKLFLAGPITAPQGKKKSAIFFSSTADGSKPPPKHVLSKSKLKKKSILIEKKSTPNYPEICYVVPGPLQRREGSGGAHWCPSKCPTVSKKSKKNVPELHLVAIFAIAALAAPRSIAPVRQGQGRRSKVD